MLFHVKHVSRYSYSRPVFCEPMEVRLRPRENDRQQLQRFRLTVDPEPAGFSWGLDEYGNTVYRCWFDRLTAKLCVTTSFIAEATCRNPYDFLLRPDATQLPLRLDSLAGRVLQPYLAMQPGEAAARLAEEVRQSAENNTLTFLPRLADVIRERYKHLIRETGAPWTAEQTIAEGQGSCRDVTVLFNEACRSVGIPARFVSGYAHSEDEREERYVHAWSEVYLPGAGWVAYDASLGLAVADEHLALACGVDHEGAAPLTGTFRGSGTRSKLKTQLVIRTGPDSAEPLPESPEPQGAPTAT